MKKILCIILSALLLLPCAACAGTGPGKSVSYAIPASPSTLDPQYASETGAKLIINNVFEGLVRYDSDGEITNGIAESWRVSDDGLVYTFRLRRDTEWYCPAVFKTQYGDEVYKKFSEAKVTADDFLYACRRAVDPATDSPNAARLMVIENATEIFEGKMPTEALGVVVPEDDKFTIIFRLTEPCDDFLARLTESEFMPCNEEFFNLTHGRYGLLRTTLLCNGPFYLSYWDPESQITIKNNKYYSGTQAVIPASVAVTFDANETSIGKKLSNGSLSAAVLSPVSDVPGEVTVLKEIPDTVTGFAFNCGDETLLNTNIRRALCLGVDRSIFSKKTGVLTPADWFIPEVCSAGHLSYRERVAEKTPSLEYSEKKALSFWQKGLEELEAEEISLTVLCPERYDLQIRQQLQIWQKIFGLSLSVSVLNLPDKEIQDNIDAGNYQIAVTSVTSRERNAVDFIEGFEGGGIFRFNDEAFSLTLDRLKTVDTDSDMLSGLLTAESIILNMGVFCTLWSSSSKFVVSNEVQGITIIDSETTVSFAGAKR